MFNDKAVHKKALIILLSVVVALFTIVTLIKYFPVAMAIIALCTLCLMVFGLIYVAIYMAVVESESNRG